MQASMTWVSREVEIPEELRAVSPRIDGFFQSLAVANESMLLLDFDGTLRAISLGSFEGQALVRGDGTAEQDSAERPHSTRHRYRQAAADTSLLLGLHPPVEIWGLHGAERLYPDGQLEREELLVHQQEALRTARDKVHSAKMGMALRVEEKWNSVAFHWRGKRPQTVRSARQRTYKLLRGFADGPECNCWSSTAALNCAPGATRGMSFACCCKARDGICRWHTLVMTQQTRMLLPRFRVKV